MDIPSYRDATVLVTGGTGSFGRTVARSLLDAGCGQLRILSRDEAKQDAMRRAFDHSPRLRFYIGDVRDRDSVAEATRGVDHVFHAAALKQVPSCEFFPIEAVRTNVLGSQNVLETAVRCGVRRVICLSTDKAVYPINAMGMTKALMEKVALAATRSVENDKTTIACVRYGNVMYSRGSVIPLFVRQIRRHEPLTITEPTMTRFLLPLEDSVALVDHAFSHAEQGDTFVKKAPACTIEVLAQALKELFASDVPIRVIGIRHGEKIFETLASREELRRAEDMGDFYRVRMDDRELDYEKFFTEGEPVEASEEDYTSHNTQQLSVEETKTLLSSLPEIQRELAG